MTLTVVGVCGFLIMLWLVSNQVSNDHCRLRQTAGDADGRDWAGQDYPKLWLPVRLSGLGTKRPPFLTAE
jgi:hypothetical protein